MRGDVGVHAHLQAQTRTYYCAGEKLERCPALDESWRHGACDGRRASATTKAGLEARRRHPFHTMRWRLIVWFAGRLCGRNTFSRLSRLSNSVNTVFVFSDDLTHLKMIFLNKSGSGPQQSTTVPSCSFLVAPKALRGHGQDWRGENHERNLPSPHYRTSHAPPVLSYADVVFDLKRSHERHSHTTNPRATPNVLHRLCVATVHAQPS